MMLERTVEKRSFVENGSRVIQEEAMRLPLTQPKEV